MYIPISEIDFDEDDIRRNAIGAGIIPIAITQNGSCRIILGKERYICYWRGSQKWSGFEGSRKTDETVEETAAREFLEESMYCIPLCGVPLTFDALVLALRKGMYVRRIVVQIEHENQTQPKYHITYIMQTTYDNHETMFSQRRHDVLKLLNDSIYFMQCARNLKNSHFPREGCTTDNKIVSRIVSVEKDDTNMIVGYEDDCENAHMKLYDNTTLCNSYEDWFHTRHACVNMAHHMREDIDPKSVIVRRDMYDNVTSISINEDIIEKQSITWWSSSDLHIVMQNGGYKDGEFFRAFFLPVLQYTVRFMDEINTLITSAQSI